MSDHCLLEVILTMDRAEAEKQAIESLVKSIQDIRPDDTWIECYLGDEIHLARVY